MSAGGTADEELENSTAWAAFDPRAAHRIASLQAVAMSSRVTMETLAQKLGVSVSTVSRVFTRPDLVNERTAQRVRAEATRLGFHPNLTARSLVQGKTRLVALVVPGLTYLIGDYYSKFRFGVERALAARGYSLVLAAYEEGRGEPLGELRAQVNVDGAIVIPRHLSREEIRHLSRAGLPCVIADLAAGPLPSVYVDNRRLGHAMVRHLVELGHRRIAALAGTDSWRNAVDRLEGVRAAAQQAELSLPDHYVQECRFDVGYDDALAKLPRFFSTPNDPGPTAIVAANDDMAAAVYRFAEQSRRKIPDDLSVIGCDNTFYSRFLSPPLTTMDQDAESVGDRAVRALLDSDESALGAVEFRTMLRGSTASPRA